MNSDKNDAHQNYAHLLSKRSENMTHPKMMYTYVGVDSHKETHTAVYMNCFFEKLGEITFGNLPADFAAFLEKSQQYKIDDTTLLFGLEDTSLFGRGLAQYLMANNQPVKHVNAYLVAQERKNNNYEKSDAADAECAARSLISKFGKLPDPEEDERYYVLRSLVVRRDFVTKNIIALKTYLHSLLTQDFPEYHKFFCKIGGKTSIAFFTKYPTPNSLHGVSLEELSQLLREHSGGLLGMERAKKILETAKNVPPVHEMRGKIVQSTIEQLNYITQEPERIETDMIKVYREFNVTLTSMVGLDVVTASQMLSCIGDIRKFPTPAKLARYAGVAPKSHSSGKKDVQFANQRGDRELNSLFFMLAARSIATYEPGRKAYNPFFYQYYHRKISEGKTTRQALKCVQRRLVSIIWTMLTKGEEYVTPPMISVENYEQQEKKPKSKKAKKAKTEQTID
jgi:transposase